MRAYREIWHLVALGARENRGEGRRRPKILMNYALRHDADDKAAPQKPYQASVNKRVNAVRAERPLSQLSYRSGSCASAVTNRARHRRDSVACDDARRCVAVALGN